ncbi:MAG: hypothetical protein ACR2QO_20060 [Acidimicrobiales bacterium]
MSATTQFDEVQDRVLSNVEAAQSRVLELNHNIADAVEDVLPTERFRLQSLPGLSEFPEPAELIDTYFDFTTKLAKVNRAFYKEMVGIWMPEPAKPAKKTAAKKASTKKAAAKKTVEA